MDNNREQLGDRMLEPSNSTEAKGWDMTYGNSATTKLSFFPPDLPFAKSRDTKSPTRGSELSAGLDFYIPNDFQETTLRGHDDICIPTGIHVNMSGRLSNYMLMAADKSGIATKHKLKIGAKIVDADYQGEVHIHIYNFGRGLVSLKPGDKIAQFILVPVIYSQPVEFPLEELYKEKTERGDGGFGSTGNL